MTKSDSELCYMSATTAIEKFKDRSLSPVELMGSIIRRTEETNPNLNAITYNFFDRVTEEAKESEKKYATKDQSNLRSLEGIPLAIKDFHPVKGEITTFGSHIFKDFRPEYTAPTVERLLNAGAIMHVRTTTPEFAYSGQCHSRHRHHLWQ